MLGCASFGLARGSQAGSARGGMPCMPKRRASEQTAPIRETQTRCGDHQIGRDALARLSSRITEDNRPTPHCSCRARGCDTRHLRADGTNPMGSAAARIDARQIPERRCLSSPARAFTVHKTPGAGAPDSCPPKDWIGGQHGGDSVQRKRRGPKIRTLALAITKRLSGRRCPSVYEMERVRASSRRPQASDAKDSPMEVDHRDVPGCVCPSGVAGIGVFAFR